LLLAIELVLAEPLLLLLLLLKIGTIGTLIPVLLQSLHEGSDVLQDNGGVVAGLILADLGDSL